jgi:hypothetical protein
MLRQREASAQRGARVASVHRPTRVSGRAANRGCFSLHAIAPRRLARLLAALPLIVHTDGQAASAKCRQDAAPVGRGAAALRSRGAGAPPAGGSSRAAADFAAGAWLRIHWTSFTAWFVAASRDLPKAQDLRPPESFWTPAGTFRPARERSKCTRRRARRRCAVAIEAKRKRGRDIPPPRARMDQAPGTTVTVADVVPAKGPPTTSTVIVCSPGGSGRSIAT